MEKGTARDTPRFVIMWVVSPTARKYRLLNNPFLGLGTLPDPRDLTAAVLNRRTPGILDMQPDKLRLSILVEHVNWHRPRYAAP